MGEAVKRSIIIILLIAFAIGLGAVLDIAIGNAEKSKYPTQYSEYVEKYSQMYNVPREVIYAIIKNESDFDPDAVSSKGAMGLMQLMPETFEWICGKAEIPYDGEKITDPETNIRCGAYYLSFCYDQFLIWDTVYAAYNAGHGQVREWLKDDEVSKNGHLTNIPFAETEAYVAKIAKTRNAYEKILEYK